MPRDYKHRAQPRTTPKRAPSWMLLLVGYLLGAMTVGLFWLKAPSRDDVWIGVEPESGEHAAKGSGADDTKAESAVAPKPRFDFYTMLPTMEVVIPEEELHEPPPTANTSAAKPTVAGRRHLLQVGSFRNEPDADRLKAQLALLGISSKIQRAEGPNNSIWYRVRTTPYETVAALRKARTRLEANGYRSLVIRAAK